MTFQDRLDITTSEGVTVSMTIAGIGSRALAWVLDGILIGVALLLLGLVSARDVQLSLADRAVRASVLRIVERHRDSATG